jgi:CubicO group peptidase (beta-lactamase class C family)
MNHKCICLFLPVILTVYLAGAQSLRVRSVDSVVKKAMATFNVPGVAVSIIAGDSVFLNKGYGFSSIEKQEKVDENTLFGIASNSKAFTAAALAILVDEGKLKWDDKLVKYIPEFKMYDAYVTREFTIADMLSHRSGLGLGAGDLLHNPDSTDFTIKDVIYSLRWLKPEASFRSRYAYDNIFYLVAAELIRRVSGQNWGDFVHERMMLPLQMNNSNTAYARVKGNANVIEGYDQVDGRLIKITRDDDEPDSGAGGIYSSAKDMSKWMLMQLNNGRYGPDLKQQLFSIKRQDEMWAPQIFLPVAKNDGYDSHFGAYGFGWFLNDAKGYKIVSHTGEDDGMISEVVLIPELHAGITVLTNRNGGGAVRAIIDQLSDYLLNVNGIDRIARWKAKVDRQAHASDTAGKSLSQQFFHPASFKPGIGAIKNITGAFKDNWFGIVTIYHKEGKLYFRSKRSLQLHGEMMPYKANTYLVKWDNPNMKADAIILFKKSLKGFTMQRALPETSFAFDFQDLNFRKL